MILKGQLAWTDYLEAQLLHWQPRGVFKILVFGALAVVGFSGVGLLFLSKSNRLVVELSVIPAIILAAALIFRYVVLPTRAKTVFDQQKDLQAPLTFEISDATLTTSNEYGKSTRPWSNFVKWKEGEKLLLLYHSDVIFTVLPKRFFIDAVQIETVRSCLSTHKVPAADGRLHTSRLVSACVLYLLIAMIVAIATYLYRVSQSQ